jgi:hypothetical protein
MILWMKINMPKLLKVVVKLETLWLMMVSCLVSLFLSLLYMLFFIEGLGYYDDGEEVLGVSDEGMDGKRRLQELARNSDSKMNKKARKLAEESTLQRGTILKHVQPGITSNGPRTTMKEKSGTLILISVSIFAHYLFFFLVSFPSLLKLLLC